MNLYEIEESLKNTIEFCCDTETGELLDDEQLANAIENLKMNKEQKITNICSYIKNLKSDVEQLKAEKMKFAKRQKVAENKIESLKQYLDTFLRNTEDIEKFKFKDINNTVSFRKSKSIEIDDIDLLDEEFIIVEKKADKKALKDAFKNGEPIIGAHEEEKRTLSIR